MLPIRLFMAGGDSKTGELSMDGVLVGIHAGVVTDVFLPRWAYVRHKRQVTHGLLCNCAVSCCTWFGCCG